MIDEMKEMLKAHGMDMSDAEVREFIAELQNVNVGVDVAQVDKNLTEFRDEDYGRMHLNQEMVKQQIPNRLQYLVDDKLVEKVKTMHTSTDLSWGAMWSDFVQGVGALDSVRKSKTMLSDYVDAIRWVAYINTHKDSEDVRYKAYIAIFPGKAAKAMMSNSTRARAKGNITQEANKYNQTPMVLALRKATMIPDYISKSMYREQAFDVLVGLINGIAPDGVKTPSAAVVKDAAIAILDKTEVPQENLLKVQMVEDEEVIEAKVSALDEIRKLAEMQHKRLSEGEDIMDVQVIGIGTVAKDE